MKKNNLIAELLKKLLAENSALYLKTQGYHWNIEDVNFYSFHKMLEEQYNNLAAANDLIAERIRQLGHKAPADWDSYNKLSSIKFNSNYDNIKDMTKDLIASNEIILQTLKHTLEESKKIDDEVTIAIVIDRMVYHEKTLWMLKSSF